ncbi:RagB/SusD family nutrient uptake outer membrane protein [Aureibacter tunicatorum]|uniref:RagB/SusD family nutrient uptake outer membrane protein n=1 Tax=Aureibacter tunicatorum TaxID=866807 RepID=A0AAE3XU64_9BACT|nr:RagB/SusD family nutrient uptake outer membrane protein [Aureibacter tunicatorum]MDR6241759.1 hypothetical protein [Aureibacter tunicatorum]BDD07380.1 membrane protein [Aureibacter tunicatorum]
MKRLFKILLLAVGVLSFSACNDFLDIDPSDKYDYKDFFKDVSHVDMAVAGAYNKVNELYMRNMSVWINTGTDELLRSINTRNENITKFEYDSFDPDLKRIWNTSYSGISRCNDVIYNLSLDRPIEDLTDEARNASLGDAYLVRGLLYLNLVRMFEHIPLRTEPYGDLSENLDQRNLPNSPANEVYDVILSDFKQAAKLLPSEASALGRGNKSVAYGMLARAYLNLAGVRTNGGNVGIDECYRQVVVACDSVDAENVHSLLPEYSEVFLNQIKGIKSETESMWEVVFNVTSNINLGGNIGTYNGPKSNLSGTNEAGSSGATFVTVKHTELYDQESDSRFDWNCADWWIRYREANNPQYYPTYITDSLRWYPAKWRRGSPNVIGYEDGEPIESIEFLENGFILRSHTSINFPLLRYSDVLLMRAEANNELNGPSSALMDLDRVRNRAGLKSLESELSEKGIFVDKEILRNELMDERSRELCYEGHRRFDLVRWGKLESTMRDLSNYMRTNPFLGFGNDDIFLATPGENVDKKHVVFPIPQDEMMLNKNIKQHPLW